MHNFSVQDQDDSNKFSVQKPENVPGYHSEETIEKAQNKPSAQGKFIVDIDLVFSTTMRLTVRNCFLKSDVGIRQPGTLFSWPRNFGKAI